MPLRWKVSERSAAEIPSPSAAVPQPYDAVREPLRKKRPSIAVAGHSRVTPTPQLETSQVTPWCVIVPFHTLRPSPEVVPRREGCCSCR